MKATPAQYVKAKFGDRAGIVAAILPLLESDKAEAKSTLMGVSNKQLMKILGAAQELKQKFGSRKDLIAKIVTLRYPNGNVGDGFLKRLETVTVKRLLEEYRQVGGK
jgi:hypothetical protein